MVFEDDGETGCLYALDLARNNDPILDAMQIYDVHAMPGGRHAPVITWSSDGLKAGLLLGEALQAVFDFEGRRGYCQTGFPEPDRRWTQHDHCWSNAAADLLR